jgi:hypothetical protein
VNTVMNLDSVKGDNFLKIILCSLCLSVTHYICIEECKSRKDGI